jgi:hypothetical protein
MCRQSGQGQVQVHPNSVGIDGRLRRNGRQLPVGVRGAWDGGAGGAWVPPRWMKAGWPWLGSIDQMVYVATWHLRAIDQMVYVASFGISEGTWGLLNVLL